MKRVGKKLKKYLIPHEENDYKPHLLRARAIGFICLLMVAAEVAVLLGPTYFATRSQLFGIIEVNALVDGTNANRVSNGLSVLTVNPLLQAAAEEKADDMVKNNYFAHTSPTGVTPWYWFVNVGYNFSYAGENLAVNFSDSADVTNAWMNSPEHRANILDPDYANIGIATATGTYQGQPATYVVELFGTPTVSVAPTAESLPSAAVKPLAAVSVAAQPEPSSSLASSAAATAVALATTSEAANVAIKGAATENLPAIPESSTAAAVATVPATATATAPIMPVSISVSASGKYVPENNPVQEAFASPRELSNDFYIFLIILMAGALSLNFFIKIRIQHPTLIFNGVFVIAMAALFVVLNQHQLLSHAMIF